MPTPDVPAPAGVSKSASHGGAVLALTAALLGWMFDGFEMGVFSLVARPALRDLLQATDEARVGLWLGVIVGIFLVGAATGGVLFGWIGDRIGRVRAMTLSVACYATFTALGGFSETAMQLGICRFIASLGMGGEWSLGVALVMEVWPNRSRAFMAGLIGAAANVGYLLVGIVGLMLVNVLGSLETGLHAVGLSDSLVARLVSNNGWRILMIIGLVPALLTFFIRIFVPESHKWEEEQRQGRTSHWQTIDLIGVLVGALGPGLLVLVYANNWIANAPLRVLVTLGCLALAVCGYIYPVRRYLERLRDDSATPEKFPVAPVLRRMLLAACLSGVALLGTWGATQQAPSWVDSLTETQRAAGQFKHAKEYTLIWLSVGAIVGTIAAAFAGDWLGRRVAYFVLCVSAFLSSWLLFQTSTEYGNWLLFCSFLAGACTASFYGWLPLYLPELFGTNVRATGQGFGFNFGRVLAAIGSFQLGGLRSAFADGIHLGPVQLAGGYPSACMVLSLVYAIGVVLIWFAPETKGQPLPE